MRNLFVNYLAIVSITLAIVSCSNQSPTSVMSKSNETIASTGAPEAYMITAALNSTTGQITLLAGNVTEFSNGAHLSFRNSTGPDAWYGWTKNTSIFEKCPLAASNYTCNGIPKFYTFNIGTNYHAWYTSNLQSVWTDIGTCGTTISCLKAAKFGTAPTDPIGLFITTSPVGGVYCKKQNPDGTFPRDQNSWNALSDYEDAMYKFDACSRGGNDHSILVVAKNSSGGMAYAVVSLSNLKPAFKLLPFVTDASPGDKTLADWDIVVARNADDRMEIFAISKYTGTIYHSWENHASACDFQPFTDYFGPSLTPMAVASSATGEKHLAVGYNQDKRLEIFYQDKDTKALKHCYQLTQGGWSDPADFEYGTGAPQGEIACETSNGRISVFFYSIIYAQFVRITQSVPNGIWSSPAPMGDYY